MGQIREKVVIRFIVLTRAAADFKDIFAKRDVSL